MRNSGVTSAIEVKYDGYEFRSKTEARWRVFFNALNVTSEYEPQAFLLPIGKGYMPDFWLRDVRHLIEIKSDFEYDRYLAEEKAYYLTFDTCCPLALIQGAPGYNIKNGKKYASFTIDIFAGHVAQTWVVPNMVGAEPDRLLELDKKAFYTSKRDLSIQSQRFEHVKELLLRPDASKTLNRRIYPNMMFALDGEKLVFKHNLVEPLEPKLVKAINLARHERFNT